MPTTDDALNAPHWDLSTFFPALESPEFLSAVADYQAYLSSSEELFDRLGVAQAFCGAVSESAFSEILEAFGTLASRSRLIRAYVSALVTTDSRNAPALAKASELDSLGVRMGKLSKRFQGWLGSGDTSELLGTELGKQYGFMIHRAALEAAHQASPELEEMISDLELTGGMAWKKLHSTVTSQIQVSFERNGVTEKLSMSAMRTLGSDPDRAVRRSAQEAELEAWKLWEAPIAAALNSIKGETLLVCAKRTWESPLNSSIFGAHIDQPTLEAMMSEAQNSFPDFRRYFKAKAKLLSVEKLAYYDLFAPLPGAGKSWNWIEAEEFILEKFGGYSAKLADFARRAFSERWIDYSPKPGKVDGAYCMGVRDDESRILMNFKSSFSAVSTLAHELGHGYHNLCLSGRPQLQRFSPMTLAETASIFCETIIRKAALRAGTDSDKLSILEATLGGSSQVVVDIASRYKFETEVFKRRADRELSPQEFCDLMLKAQIDTYGDGLDESTLHNYMWAVKSHYYGRSFYNFPYMFGLLFGLGLYSVYEREGVAFQARYDDLLASTGVADASTLADRFGIDLRSSEFWRGSLDQIRESVDEFEALVDAR